MDNKKDDAYFVVKALDNINAIINYTKNISYEDFISNELLIDAVMFRFIQMAENINHLSKDFIYDTQNIPWNQIIGFRNGIVHNYGKTDYKLVYEIISTDIFTLKEYLEKFK